MSFVDPWHARAVPAFHAQKVAMFHFGRCGSTVTANLLRQSPPKQIYWEGEIFDRQRHGHYSHLHVANSKELIAQRAQEVGAAIYGFETKVFSGQDLAETFPDFTGYRDFLGAVGFEKFILFKRRNLIDQILSFYVGRQRQAWHCAPDERVEKVMVHLPLDDLSISNTRYSLIDLLDAMTLRWATIDTALAGLPVLELFYEDDVRDDPCQAYRKICQFIGLDAQRNPNINYQRTNPFSKADVIENFDELEAHLSGTEYAPMLR